MSFLPAIFRRSSEKKSSDSSGAREQFVSQYASRVVNFSSQYGTAGSNSYVAANLAGDRQLEGKYGDFVEAFVLVSVHNLAGVELPVGSPGWSTPTSHTPILLTCCYEQLARV